MTADEATALIERRYSAICLGWVSGIIMLAA